MEKYPALYLPQTKQLISLAKFGTEACVIGRDPEASVQIPDLTCSRRQFSVVAHAGQYTIEGLSQSVPTLRNGEALRSPANLQHDDQIVCGGTRVVFLTKDADASDGGVSFSLPSSTPVRARFAASPPSIPDPPLPQQATVVGNFREEMEAIEHPAEIPLNGNAVIGRTPDPGGITLDHPRVSRRHAEVRVTGEQIFLRDLGSGNGTFVNGERITAYRELRPGDRIDIGPYSFKFRGRSLVQSTREGDLRVVARNLTRTVRSHSDGKTIRILDNVSIVVEPGEFVCILGSSGSGKSTLMQALSARQPADQGQVFLNDVSLYANFQTVKQSIALVPQKDVLHEDLSLAECIRYTAELRLPPDTGESGLKSAVGQAIEGVDLKHRASTPIKHLSGGQKKRAALANETVSKPELLFLDEVTSGLDEGTDWEMMRLFRRMADSGMTVICVTHTVANVEDFCHKIIVMTPPGMLAYYGPPAAAKRYFGLQKLGDVYRKLAEAPGEEWRDRYRSSEEYRRYIEEPLMSAPAESATPARPADQSGRVQDELPEVKRQFGILTSRFSKLLAADRKTLTIAFAQSGLIGIFLVLVFGSTPAGFDPKQFSLIFFLGISCFWCGCNNASKEIVKERFIYAIERDVNLSVASYMLSKAIMLGIFGILQVALLFGIVYTFGSVPGDATRQLISMTLSVLAGTAMGLFLSAAARTEDQASTLVPIALIPQILLAGVIIRDLPKIPDIIAHAAISGFWVYRAMESVLTNKMDDANFAWLILAVHTIVLLIAAGVLLYVRDSRGQLVWGKAINQRLKG